MIIKITLRYIQLLDLNLNLIQTIEYGNNKSKYNILYLVNYSLNYIVFSGRGNNNNFI